jgi:hypothetical protein
MKRVSIIVVAAITVVALAAVPALALQERGQAGQSGQSGERGSGAAAAGRPGEAGGPAGGGGGPSGPSGPGGSSGGGGFGGGNMGSSGGGSMGSSGGGASSIRMRGGDFGRSPRGGGERTAVPRGDGAGPSKGSTPTVTGEGGTSYAAGPIREVPQHSRPRGNRPTTGQAVPRGKTGVPPRQPIYPSYYHPDYWYWNPYGYGYPYYGSFGLGFFYYDPIWWGYPAGSYYGAYSTGLDHTGTLRLKIRPRSAEVLVDGYYVGIVNEFDGIFQRLRLETGGHRIEIRADGYEPLVFDVLIPPFETVTYTGELKKKNP